MSQQTPISYGVCLHSLLPVHASGDHRSEQVTQLLYGECFMVLQERSDGWAHIQIRHDGYRGWILAAQAFPIDEEVYEQYGRTQQFCSELISYVQWESGRRQPLLLGSPLIDLSLIYADGAIYHGENYLFKPLSDFARLDNLQEMGNAFLGAPYMWGGRSPFGVDCSGLVQVLMRMIQVRLSRDANQQAEEGKLVAVEERQFGDLAFFRGDNSQRIQHVGIVWHSEQVLHASARGVRLDSLQKKGIYDGEKYTHQLAWIRRHV